MTQVKSRRGSRHINGYLHISTQLHIDRYIIARVESQPRMRGHDAMIMVTYTDNAPVPLKQHRRNDDTMLKQRRCHAEAANDTESALMKRC